MITLITTTGSRSDCFALCERYIARQSYTGPVQWIVVCDNWQNPTKCTMNQEFIKGPTEWKPNINTQRENMRSAISKIKGDLIFVAEDDDFYASNYLETYIDLLKYVDIIGEGNAKYYNIAIPGWKEMKNTTSSSLSQTGFRKSMLPMFEKAVESGHFYFDIELWREVKDKNIPNIILNNSGLSIGIKGMPGREGLTGSHREKRDYFYDGNLIKLKEWIGDDIENYLPYIKNGSFKKAS